VAEARDIAQVPEPPWLRLLRRHLFWLQVLGSVSIEVPALRPEFERLRKALDGDD
jgi:hypothetical protein